ncbi:hypothetical protein OROHE_019591 [Orobanche hederae]
MGEKSSHDDSDDDEESDGSLGGKGAAKERGNKGAGNLPWSDKEGSYSSSSSSGNNSGSHRTASGAMDLDEDDGGVKVLQFSGFGEAVPNLSSLAIVPVYPILAMPFTAVPELTEREKLILRQQQEPPIQVKQYSGESSIGGPAVPYEVPKKKKFKVLEIVEEERPKGKGKIRFMEVERDVDHEKAEAYFQSLLAQEKAAVNPQEKAEGFMGAAFVSGGGTASSLRMKILSDEALAKSLEGFVTDEEDSEVSEPQGHEDAEVPSVQRPAVPDNSLGIFSAEELATA